MHSSNKNKLRRVLEEKRESKVMHGQYIKSVDRQLISKVDMFLWLSRGDLKGQTENEIIAAQHHTLQTTYHAQEILQTDVDSEFRLCKPEIVF
jgi:hypothetical protein